MWEPVRKARQPHLNSRGLSDEKGLCFVMMTTFFYYLLRGARMAVNGACDPSPVPFLRSQRQNVAGSNVKNYFSPSFDFEANEKQWSKHFGIPLPGSLEDTESSELEVPTEILRWLQFEMPRCYFLFASCCTCLQRFRVVRLELWRSILLRNIIIQQKCIFPMNERTDKTVIVNMKAWKHEWNLKFEARITVFIQIYTHWVSYNT